MKHLAITITDLSSNAINEVDSNLYDKPYYFSNKEGTLRLRATHVNSGSEHIPQFVFLPWGWSLEVPVIRTYNLYLQKHYYADIYYYELRHIHMTKLDPNIPVFEQLARRWLEAHIDQGLIIPGKPILITGPSLGGYISTIINSIAHEYGVVVGNIYAWEPGGMTKKSVKEILKQVSDDTVIDYEESYNSRYKIVLAKVGLALKTVRNKPRFIQRAAKEIAAGNLATYFNKYLETQKGVINIGHGADSTFVTFKDLEDLDKKLIDPSRVISHDYAGYKHGLGRRALGMAAYFSAFTAKNQ